MQIWLSIATALTLAAGSAPKATPSPPSLQANVLGDATPETVTLTSTVTPDNPLSRDLVLTVTPVGAPAIRFALPPAAIGYRPRLACYDFTGDGLAEVWVSLDGAGSGGTSDHLVVSFAEGQPHLLLDSTRGAYPAVTGEFVNGYKARIRTEPATSEVEISLLDRKREYDAARLYRQGRLLRPTPLWGGERYTGARAVDPDRDGVYELQVEQDLRGLTNLDRVAHVVSRLSFEASGPRATSIRVSQVPRR